MEPYRPRTVDVELSELFDELAAIAIDGPKAVGKTTTAHQHVGAVINLDSKRTREAVEAEPDVVASRERPLLIDEWQKVPEVWDVVRHVVDRDRRPGQFLLVGSASPAPGATAHSGAGRIGRLRMRAMTLEERGVATPTVSVRTLLQGGAPTLAGECPLTLVDYVGELVASGLPGLRGLGTRALNFQLDSYLHNIVDRDVPDQGLAVRRPDALRRWMAAYAAASSTTANYSQILDASTPGHVDKPARATGISYREVLTELMLLDPVPAWLPTGSPLTRLGQTPKHQLADPALAARLLGLGADALLEGAGDPLGPQAGGLLGHLFESLATLCLRVPAQACDARITHLRTRNGDHEVDLMAVRADGKALAVEVKLGGTITDRDVRHLVWLRQRLGPSLLDAIVLTTGPTAYRRRDGIGVVPLGLLGL